MYGEIAVDGVVLHRRHEHAVLLQSPGVVLNIYIYIYIYIILIIITIIIIMFTMYMCIYVYCFVIVLLFVSCNAQALLSSALFIQ